MTKIKNKDNITLLHNTVIFMGDEFMSENGHNTKQSICEAACEEFLEKGYQAASLRRIVQKAGVTTGAFYGYYKSKEELFSALVEEEYNYIIDLYNKILYKFTQLEPEQQRDDMQDYTAIGMNNMISYMYDHKVAFKLILCCSVGTKYDHFIHDLAEMDIKATHDFSETMENAGVTMKSVNPQLEHMITSGMFSAFSEMIVHDIPQEESGEYIRQLLDFYTAGWQKIMGF